ncbi:hypothetical protein JYT84_00140 [bacterium AH-315-M10]|nr:hypothetical protein [bacterium AH-315-M10]
MEDPLEAEAERAAWNAPRYRSTSRGMYEVWYVTAIDPVSQLGLWIRYTIGVSADGVGQGGLWLSAFDRKHPAGNLAHRQMFPLAEVQVGPTGVAIGERGIFDGRRLVGELTDCGQKISWDLSLEPKDEPTPMLPGMAYRSRLIQTKLVGVTLDARLSGTMTIGEQTWDFDDIPAAQSHLWGTRHAHAWTWVHCNAFDVAGVVFEGLVARVRRFGLVSPPLTQLYLRIGDREYPLVGWWRALRSRSEVARGPNWEFRGTGEGVEVSGRVTCRAEDLVGVDYRDPDESPLVCYNSEVASMELQVRYRGTDHYESFRSDGTTAFEFAGRDLPAIAPRTALSVAGSA